MMNRSCVKYSDGPSCHLLFSFFCLLFLSELPAGAAEIDFNRDIRPILSNKCMSCHGPDEEHREADLRLDSEESAKQDRDGYAVIKPGSVKGSSLIERVRTDDPDLKMPPPELKKELTAVEMTLLEQWIASGAKWATHWAYVAPQKFADVEVENKQWNGSFVDRYIFQKLQEQNLQPSPEADRITLLRRLSFDLTGLPPASAQVDAFVNDRSPGAYEKVVDRLLNSDRFGEQLAVYWLDLVRYADTVGYHGDQDHNISPYRDWVIHAFNSNMPFDQFTREQLAGDLLPGSTIQQKIASGYNRLLQTSHEGGVQPKEYLAIYAADRMRNLSAVWMGATFGCAQCHDHKYDPYTMRDFYSMQAFFADLDEAQHFKVGGNSLPTNRPPELTLWNRDDQKQYDQLKQEIRDLENQLNKTTEKKQKPNDASAIKAFKEKIERLKKEAEAIRKRQRKSMISVAIEPRVIRILPRGNWLDDSGEIVSPAIPQFLGKLETGGKRPTRLDLANWLVDERNGVGLMTARVFVNRLWYLMFGNGLADLADFGGQGEPPTHPKLLDRLAIEFVESGWNVKHLVRLLVVSRTYRQQSLVTDELRKKDPGNKWYARQSRYRLPAESIRDTALAISRLLVEEVGGESVKPYQPAGYYRHLNFPKRTYQHDTDSKQYRRGVYVHWQRQFLHPMLKAFDAPSREECTAKRPRSNTPLAALTLLNDPTFMEAARAFAGRILLEGGESRESKIEFACREALSRLPDETEQKILMRVCTTQLAYYKEHPDRATKLLAVGLAPNPEGVDPCEQAAWTQVARILLNLNETTTRN